MNIPEEIVEKAARALYAANTPPRHRLPWDEVPEWARKHQRTQAIAALSAAAPALMAMAWDEARYAYREDVSKGDVWRRNPYKEAL